MKKELFSRFIVLVMVGIIIFLGIMASKEKRKQLAPIGQTIVIDSDTLIVVNYEGGGYGKPSGYRLSNGVLVNRKIIDSYEIQGFTELSKECGTEIDKDIAGQ